MSHSCWKFMEFHFMVNALLFVEDIMSDLDMIG